MPKSDPVHKRPASNCSGAGAPIPSGARADPLTETSAVSRFAVFASGRGSNLEALFESLADHPEGEIVLVASDRPEARALNRAERRGVATAVVDPDDAEAILDQLEGHGIDWVVLAGYLKRIPASVVDRYRGRILNVHPALLPDFGGKGMYGMRVHRAVLEAGRERSGATVHIVDEKYDHGPVVAQRAVPVEPGDTPESLAERVLAVEHRLLSAVVRAAAEGRVRSGNGRAWVEGEIE